MSHLQLEHRQLTLMFTDIVGYSRLMGKDQATTISMLEDYRRILVEEISRHQGTVIEFIGDAVFARFETPIEGTNAAIAIQKALFSFNHFRDKNLPRLQTRIGLHTGEVASKGNALFGDHVNIAARLEPIAVADGICVSDQVFKAVKDKIKEPILSLGVQPLKNIQSKVKAYLIRPLGINLRIRGYYLNKRCSEKVGAYRYAIAASVIFLIAAAIYFIPRWLVPGYDANYVEIADFRNINSTNGAADYFSAGLTDAVRSQLADVRDLYIVDPMDKIKAPVALEGSVLKMGDNIRIEYRIFRKRNNVQIAGGKLDGRYKDVMIIQDRLVGEIAQHFVTEFDLEKFRPAPLQLTNDISAYDFYLKGKYYLSQPASHNAYDSAIQMFNTAIVHDSEFSSAYTGLCEAYRSKYNITYDTRWINDAKEECDEALRISPESPETLALSGLLLADKGELQAAIERLEQARSMDPRSAVIINSLAELLMRDNRVSEAEALHLTAISYAPDDWEILNEHAFFLMNQSRYDEAINKYKKILDLSPGNVSALHNIGTAYFYQNKLRKSVKYLKMAAEIEPFADTLTNIATLYSFIGDNKNAIYYNKEALRLEPNRVQFLVNLGQNYFHSEEKKLAKKYLSKAIKLGKKETETAPGKANLYHYIAIAYALLGETNKAKVALESASTYGPDSFDLQYSRLVIAVIENNPGEIINATNKLIEFGYNKELILVDPNFKTLQKSNLLANLEPNF